MSKRFTSSPEVKLAFHHESLALETAAHAGCPVCSIYRRDIRKFAWDEFNGGFLPSKDDVLTMCLKEGGVGDAFEFEICVHVPKFKWVLNKVFFLPSFTK